MKINIGAGWSKFDGYLNCDISPVCNPDFVFDLERDIWPFEDNSVDAVIAHHVLEHLGDGYFHALKELYRVCKPDAIVDIWVPHYAHHNFFHDPTHRRAITPTGLELFDKFNNYKSSSAASKLGLMIDIDLRVMEYEAIVDCRYQYLQQYPAAAIEEMAFEKKNLIEEYRIKLKVVKWSPNHYRIYKYYLELLGRLCSPDEVNLYIDLDCSDEDFKLKIMNSEEYKRRHLGQYTFVEDINLYGQNFQFVCHPLGTDLYVSDSIINHKVYDPVLTEYWFNHIRPGDVVVDVGANIGWFSKIASLKTGNVISIEPDDRAFSLLKFNCPTLELRQVCAGDSTAQIGFTPSEDNYGDGRTATDGSVVREQDTIDNIVGDRKVSAIKIDAQGWEPKIIAGAMNTINNMDPGSLVILEHWPYGLAANGFDDSFLAEFLQLFTEVKFIPNEHTTSDILDKFAEACADVNLFGDFVLKK